MRANKFQFSTLLIATVLVISCERKTEDFQTDQIADYLPLQTGKYITYRLDSTVFVQAGTVTQIHSYQEKHIVDAMFNDNLGRPSYRIFRYIRDTAGITGWNQAGSYYITPLRNTAEVVEHNLRSIKLVLPIKQDQTWKGNRFMPLDPYSTLVGDDAFGSDNNIQDWDFTYTDVDASLTLKGQTYNNVLKVIHIDEMVNIPIVNPRTYAFWNYSEDNYAKGIGLIYQNFIFWEHEPNPSGSPFKRGFAVKRSMIDHN